MATSLIDEIKMNLVSKKYDGSLIDHFHLSDEKVSLDIKAMLESKLQQ